MRNPITNLSPMDALDVIRERLKPGQQMSTHDAIDAMAECYQIAASFELVPTSDTKREERYLIEHQNNIAVFNLWPVSDVQLEDFATHYGWMTVPEKAALRDLGDRTIISMAFMEEGDMEGYTDLIVLAELDNDKGMSLFNDGHDYTRAYCRLEVASTL